MHARRHRAGARVHRHCRTQAQRVAECAATVLATELRMRHELERQSLAPNARTLTAKICVVTKAIGAFF
jgi:hypothetical protein